MLPPIDPSSPIPGPCHVEGGVTPLAPGQKAASGIERQGGSIAVPVPVAEKVKEVKKGKSEL